MSKARDLADLGGVTARLDEVGNSDGALSNRNLIINGAMQVAQRGTSATSSGYQTVDRWYAQENTGGAVTWSQSADAPDGFVNSLGIEVTTADSSIATNEYTRIFQNVEGNVLARLAWGGSGAKPAMLSFWVKSSITGTFGVSFQDGDIAIGYLQSYSVNSADTWEYKTVYVSPPTSGTWPTDNTRSLRMAFVFGMGSQYTQPASSTWYTGGDYRGPDGVTNFMGAVGNTLNITGVQLEVGDQSTPFEHRSYGDELQRCQRYYKDHPAQSMNYHGFRYNGSISLAEVHFPVTMRIAPTIAQSGNGTATSVVPSVNGFTVAFNDTDGNIINAYTADAEL